MMTSRQNHSTHRHELFVRGIHKNNENCCVHTNTIIMTLGYFMCMDIHNADTASLCTDTV